MSSCEEEDKDVPTFVSESLRDRPKQMAQDHTPTQRPEDPSSAPPPRPPPSSPRSAAVPAGPKLEKVDWEMFSTPLFAGDEGEDNKPGGVRERGMYTRSREHDATRANRPAASPVVIPPSKGGRAAGGGDPLGVSKVQGQNSSPSRKRQAPPEEPAVEDVKTPRGWPKKVMRESNAGEPMTEYEKQRQSIMKINRLMLESLQLVAEPRQVRKNRMDRWRTPNPVYTRLTRLKARLNNEDAVAVKYN